MKSIPIQLPGAEINVINMAKDYDGKRRLAWKKVLESGRLDEDGLLNFHCPFHVLKGSGPISKISCRCVFHPAIKRFTTDCGEKGHLMQLSEALTKTRKAELERRIEQEGNSITSGLARELLAAEKMQIP